MTSDRFSVRKLALLGMMTAVVFAGNYLRITMPVAIGGQTSFTLANIFCCLSGLLLGPVGGLAAGLGSAFYDLTDPRFVAECWITFLNKGAMGLAAGVVALPALKRDRLGYGRALAGTLLGCGVYYVLYFAKNFFYNGLLLKGLTPEVAAVILVEKLPASFFNAAVALIGAPLFALAVRQALKRSGLDKMTRA